MPIVPDEEMVKQGFEDHEVEQEQLTIEEFSDLLDRKLKEMKEITKDVERLGVSDWFEQLTFVVGD